MHKKLMVETKTLGILNSINSNNLHCQYCKPNATKISLGVIDLSEQDSMFYVWIANLHIHGDLSLTCYSGNK
jgi:hypothetical protein